MAATGKILDLHGGAGVLWGWYTAHAAAGAVCAGALVLFAFFARGERIFN